MKLAVLDISKLQYNKELLLEARKQLHILEGTTLAQPELIARLFDVTVLQEALKSSEIEGIHTTPFEVFAYDLLKTNKSSPEEKVSNYRKAIIDLISEKEDYYPITHRSFTKLHNNILPNEDSNIRKTNRKIVNHKTGEVRFIPPDHTLLPDFITDLENFINSKDIDILIKIPITHYQFECVHPFSDGNGRTGRLLILLQLLDSNMLKYPVVHLSKFINKDKSYYSDLLLKTTKEECWGELIDYFSIGMIETVKSTIAMIVSLKKHILYIEEVCRKELPTGNDPSKIANYLIANPVTNIQEFSDSIGVARDTGKKYLNILKNKDIMVHKKIGVNSVYGDLKTLEILQN